jgi:large subunit ribosomal protein L17
MAQSLFQHGKVVTTLPKAKTIRPYVERLISLAVLARERAAADDRAGSLSARRAIHKLLADRVFVPAEHQAAFNALSDAGRAKTLGMVSGRRYRTGESKGRLDFTAESVTYRLIQKIAPRFEDRPGGYTRLIRLPDTRVGDSSPLAMLQLVGDEIPPTSLTKPKASARRRRADSRYALAVKLAKEWSAARRADRGAGPQAESEAGSAAEPASTDSVPS